MGFTKEPNCLVIYFHKKGSSWRKGGATFRGLQRHGGWMTRLVPTSEGVRRLGSISAWIKSAHNNSSGEGTVSMKIAYGNGGVLVM